MLTIVPDGSNQLVFELSGNFYGSMDDFNNTIQPLLDSIPQANLTSQQFTWIEALANVAGSLSTTSPEPVDNFYAKSLMVRDLVSNSSLANWVEYMYTQGTADNLDVSWFVEVDVYGGEITRASSNVTSFFNRNAFLTFQFYASAKKITEPYPSSGLTFVSGMHDALKVDPEAAYPNYIDPALSSNQWQSQYYGSNYPRLVEIKKAVDPQNVFRFPQSIGSTDASLPNSTSTDPASSSPTATTAPAASGGFRMVAPFGAQTTGIVVFSLFLFGLGFDLLL